jgi:hypothetical protein
MVDIIDKVNNPFARDSWIEEGFSFTPDLLDLAPRLFKRIIKKSNPEPDTLRSFRIV